MVSSSQGRTSIALQHLDSSSSASWTHGGASATMPFAFPLPLLECRGDSIAEGLDRKRTVSGAVTSVPGVSAGHQQCLQREKPWPLEPTVNP